jgi:hypothetical protein
VQKKLLRWKVRPSLVSIWLSVCPTHWVKRLRKCYFLVQISFPLRYFNCPISCLQETILCTVTYKVIMLLALFSVSRSDDEAASKYRVTGAFCPDRRTGGRKHRHVRRPVAHATFVRMRLPHHLFISSFFQSQNEPVVGQYVTWTVWISTSRLSP